MLQEIIFFVVAFFLIFIQAVENLCKETHVQCRCSLLKGTDAQLTN